MMCMCSVPWCIVHVSVSSSFVNLQDVFEGLSKNGQMSGVHNFESQGSGYFYGTVKDVHLAILTAVTATPLQVHVSLLELGMCLFGAWCTASCSHSFIHAEWLHEEWLHEEWLHEWLHGFTHSCSVLRGSSHYTSLSLVPSSWG